jgi:hypothetical protein
VKSYARRWWRFWVVCAACSAPCWVLTFAVPLKWAWVVAGPVSLAWGLVTYKVVGKRLVPRPVDR